MRLEGSLVRLSRETKNFLFWLMILGVFIWGCFRFLPGLTD